MVEVASFRGVFYDAKKVSGLDKVVSLPYDIVSPEKQEEYYRSSEYNIIRLILGKDRLGDNGKNKYTRAREHLNKWLKTGVLVQDERPSIYVYQQEYVLNGKVKKQVGFIALVKLEPFEKGVILPHEKVYRSVLEDRYSLLESTQANLEPIMGVYSDPKHTLRRIFSDLTKSKPLLELKHADDITHMMWKVDDADSLRNIAEVMRDKRLYIADGHHRYITSLKYHQNHGGGDKPCKYIMMLLLNMEDDLNILAPHRLLKNIPDFNVNDTVNKIRKFFKTREYVSDGGRCRRQLIRDLKSHKGRHVFGMVVRDRCFLLSLKKDGGVDSILDSTKKSKHLKELDVTILHDVVINHILGMNGNNNRKDDIIFVKDLPKVFKFIDDGEYEIAFLLNPPKLKQMKAVSDSGEVMPQKSTYFYPKILSGLVMYKF